MSDHFETLYRGIYSVRSEPSEAARIEFIPGSDYPMKLVLSLQDHLRLKRALLEPPQGAILELHTTVAAVGELFVGIKKLFQTMGWPLPKEGEDRS